MKAVRCKDRAVCVTDVETPKGEGVRVKVASAGICGSDLHMVSLGFPIPFTLGHEIAGIAENGAAVAIEPLAACGHCEYCVRGDYNLCELGAQMIIGVGRDGGMAEEVLVPARCLVPLPSGLPVEDACLIEPLSVAVHGLAMTGLTSKQRVAIIGGGSIGLCAVAMAKMATAEVYLVARHDAQRKAGEQLGAKLNVGGDYDLVVDCAGNNESIAQAVSLCKPGGTILLLATYWSGLTFPNFELFMKQPRIFVASSQARHGLTRDVDIAASAMARNPLIAQTIITHRLPLEAAPEAFAIANNRAAGAIKVTMNPR